MRADWKHWATEADVIVIVGAQPYFTDAHIWDPIVGSLGAVWFIGGKGGDFEGFADRIGEPLDYLGDRFASSLTTLLERVGQLRDNAHLIRP
jgi:hypothetical protein